MLYWICPECGHECSPAIRECPTCTAPPVDQASAATKPLGSNLELLSLAEGLQPPASAPVTAAVSLRQVTATANGHEESSIAVAEEISRTEAVLDKEVVSNVEVVSKKDVPREPPLYKKLAPLDHLVARPARPEVFKLTKPSASPVPVRLSLPSVSPAWSPIGVTSGLSTAGAVPAREISFEAARSTGKPLGQPSELLPARRQSVAFVRPELLGMDHGNLALAELAEVDNSALKQLALDRNGQPKNGASSPLAYGAAQPSVPPSRLKLAGASLVELLSALQASAEQLEREAIQNIQASFRGDPSVTLLSAPAEIVAAPAPPSEQWIRSQKLQLTPVAPEKNARATVLSGPQTPTLAGPCLPPQLLNFQQTSSLRGKRNRGASWLINLLLAIVVMIGVVFLLQYVTQDRDTKAASVAPPAPTVKAATAPRVRVVEEHPAARSVEVAGVRVVTGPDSKPQLQYIVINHSANELMGLNIRIAVRSVEALADPPLFSVSSVVATLGPNQSKEIRMDLDSSIQPSAIPDWQSLRTEVLVARQ